MHDELALDLTSEQLERRFLTPRREGRSVTLGGQTLGWDEIERIRINETTQTSAQLLPIIQAERAARRGVVVGISDEWYVTDRGEDVTDDLITEPIGSQAAAASAASSPGRKPENVAVAYGRDTEAVTAIFGFLRHIGLRPLRWEQLRQATGTSTPYTGEIVDKAFEISQAVVVLFTPDDEARLHPDLRGQHEPETERELTGQPRQNVLIEAGMALSTHRRRTIIVEIGSLRPITNLAGLNTVRIGSPNTVDSLNELTSRLETAQCPVDRAVGPGDWIRQFEQLAAHDRSPAAPGFPATTPSSAADPLVLEVQAAAARGSVTITQSHTEAFAAALRAADDPIDFAVIAGAMPAPRFLVRDARAVASQLHHVGVLTRSTRGGRGLTLTDST
jgi:predicted nucleotide-binding protein